MLDVMKWMKKWERERLEGRIHRQVEWSEKSVEWRMLNVEKYFPASVKATWIIHWISKLPFINGVSRTCSRFCVCVHTERVSLESKERGTMELNRIHTVSGWVKKGKRINQIFVTDTERSTIFHLLSLSRSPHSHFLVSLATLLLSTQSISCREL